ncbi:PREDICTED: uncharacterized protein LOC104806335 [Tarenaya hassleriana]|uniref:uncharacterized protein LOC104806335 n=1 Tax=Tarenaya hassleriana TaxID=28532 RepID=UPI0008FD38FC|nr:PREDICTED: uncharacterized protein LOC104806335 [Tarenaya hassleriana]XP_019057261.1 PREDICTED: uncharacterized protein LOC104806335 [Tarenaya hassleriana]
MAKPSQSTRHLGTLVDVTRYSTHQSTSMKALAASSDKTLSKKQSARERELYSTATHNVVRGRANESRRTEEECDDGDGCSLDLLFLVHSDLSTVLRQIDELVVQATNLRTVSKHGTAEIESFRCVLSDMLTSLKPWVPRLHKAISDTSLQAEDRKELSLMSSSCAHLSEEELLEVESPEHTKFDSLISPSPLVSWRGDLNIDKGKQLFVLTPLAVGKNQSSKYQKSSKPMTERMTLDAASQLQIDVYKETGADVVRGECTKAGLINSVSHATDLNENLVEIVPVSSPVYRRKAQSELLMTPCLKMSPPKSCTMLDPASRSPHQAKQQACKSTHPDFGTSHSTGSHSSGSGYCGNSDDLALKYPELLGIQHAQISRKTDAESSPNWLFSPPKTCIMLEPVDEKAEDEAGDAIDMLDVCACPDNREEFLPGTKNIKEHERNSSVIVESTPMCKGFQSTIGKNRRAGESTLKRELWTRFEAATTQGIPYNSTVVRGTSKKGFLEMLEEVSGNEETS